MRAPLIVSGVRYHVVCFQAVATLTRRCQRHVSGLVETYWKIWIEAELLENVRRESEHHVAVVAPLDPVSQGRISSHWLESSKNLGHAWTVNSGPSVFFAIYFVGTFDPFDGQVADLGVGIFIFRICCEVKMQKFVKESVGL